MPLPRPSRKSKTEEISKAEAPLERRQFRPSDVFRFHPKSDITTDELALLVSIFWELDVSYSRFMSFTSDLQRHFSIND